MARDAELHCCLPLVLQRVRFRHRAVARNAIHLRLCVPSVAEEDEIGEPKNTPLRPFRIGVRVTAGALAGSGQAGLHIVAGALMAVRARELQRRVCLMREAAGVRNS